MDPVATSRPSAGATYEAPVDGHRPDVSGMPGPVGRWVDRFWRLRARAQRGRIGRTVWKVAVSVLGLLIIVAGIVLLPLPGPGWLIIFGGLGIWATEFAWAGRLLEWTKLKVRAVTGSMLRWPRWVKGVLIVVCLAAIYPLWLAYQWVKDWLL